MEQQVILPCLHTLTRAEALELEAAADAASGGGAGAGFNCSICNHLCTTKASELIVDAVAERASAAPPQCDCEENLVSVHCVECNRGFCDRCFGLFHAVGKRKQHTQVPIMEYLAGGSAGGAKPKLMCPKHTTSPLGYFCTEAGYETTICAVCAAEEYVGRTYVKLSDAVGTNREKIDEAVQKAVEALAATHDGIDAINAQLVAVAKSKDEAHSHAEALFKGLQRDLIARKRAVQADAEAEKVRKDELLQKQKSGLEGAQERLESGLELAHRVQEGASEVELLQIMRMLTNGLDLAIKHGVALTPRCGPSVLFASDAEEIAALRAQLATLCAISGSDTDPERCTAAGDGLTTARLGHAAVFDVVAVDYQGARRTGGGDNVVLSLLNVDANGGGGGGGGGSNAAISGDGDGSGGNVVKGMVDNGNGTYSCTYTIPEGSLEGAWQLGIQLFGQHVAGSPFAVEVTGEIVTTFVHTAAFDGKGVLHWIGTAGGTKGYENPHGKPGGVVAAMSSVGDGGPSRFVEHTAIHQNNVTTNTLNSWMSVDLGQGRKLNPNHYCLRHSRMSGDMYRLRNWRLEGSNDGSAWTPIKTHTNDKSIPSGGFSTASWAVDGANGAAYQHFRIFLTGRDANNQYYLYCGGIELYGTLTDASASCSGAGSLAGTPGAAGGAQNADVLANFFNSLLGKNGAQGANGAANGLRH